MTTQKAIDKLKADLQQIDERMSEARADVERKRHSAGEALLEGRNASKAEREIAAIEQRLKSLEQARIAGQNKLASLTKSLRDAERDEAQERIDTELKRDIDRAATKLQSAVDDVFSAGNDLDRLLAECASLRDKYKVSTAKIGALSYFVGSPAPSGSIIRATFEKKFNRGWQEIAESLLKSAKGNKQ